MTSAEEQRHYRSGKLARLFPQLGPGERRGRSVSLGEKLLEVVRIETRSKTAIGAVQLTPQGAEFICGKGIRCVLEEVRDLLYTTREECRSGMTQIRPDWQAARERWPRMSANSQRLDANASRGRAACGGGPREWKRQTLATSFRGRAAPAYLDRRKEGGRPMLPARSYYRAAVDTSLTIPNFTAMRPALDRRAVELLPFESRRGLPLRVCAPMEIASSTTRHMIPYCLALATWRSTGNNGASSVDANDNSSAPLNVAPPDPLWVSGSSTSAALLPGPAPCLGISAEVIRSSR